MGGVTYERNLYGGGGKESHLEPGSRRGEVRFASFVTLFSQEVLNISRRKNYLNSF